MLFCVWTVSRPRPDDEIEEFGESSDDLTMVRGSAAYGAGVACWSQDVSRRIAGFLRLACRTCRGKCLKTTKMRWQMLFSFSRPLLDCVAALTFRVSEVTSSGATVQSTLRAQ